MSRTMPSFKILIPLLSVITWKKLRLLTKKIMRKKRTLLSILFHNTLEQRMLKREICQHPILTF